jgi:mono/diheme cytochrome c family protein
MSIPHRAACAAFLLLTAICVGSASALAQGPMSSNPAPAPPSPATPPSADGKSAKAPLDVKSLFASTCGWCHSNGGRSPGKGPQLMGTTLTDAEIANRIRNGKTGQMPAFGSTFSDDDIKAIIRYIRELRES